MYLMRTRAVGVFAEIETAGSAGNRIIEAFPARSVAKLPHGGAEHLDCLDVLDDHKNINDRLGFDSRNSRAANVMYRQQSGPKDRGKMRRFCFKERCPLWSVIDYLY